MADKARLRRARHKGGYVPGQLKKVQVEYFDSDEEKETSNKENPEKDAKSDEEEDLTLSLADKTTLKEKEAEKSVEKHSAADTEKKMGRKTVEMYDLML